MTKDNEEQVNLIRALGGAMAELRQELDTALAAAGVTSAQANMLVALAAQPDIPGAELARKCKVTPQTIHKMLVSAEKEGWLKREKKPDNDKALFLNLTAEGRKVLSKAQPARLQVIKRMLRGFSAADLAQFQGFAVRCSNNLTQ
jgi:DNA-binding MarR family transcriptional regulator